LSYQYDHLDSVVLYEARSLNGSSSSPQRSEVRDDDELGVVRRRKSLLFNAVHRFVAYTREGMNQRRVETRGWRGHISWHVDAIFRKIGYTKFVLGLRRTSLFCLKKRRARD